MSEPARVSDAEAGIDDILITRRMLDGGNGDDVELNGELGADFVSGGPGDDLVAAGFAPDDPGDDVLLGGSGDDLVAFAAAGDDRLEGGPGDDTIRVVRATTGSAAARASTASEPRPMWTWRKATTGCSAVRVTTGSTVARASTGSTARQVSTAARTARSW
jgi:Ca2+-binding RTX toxin-like protein